jgi:hypothetical protein
MAPAQSKTSAAANFFAPKTRRNMPAQNYGRIERPQFNRQNPPRPRSDPSTTPAPSSTPSPSSPLPTGEDTIVYAPPGHPDCESDDDMPDADTCEETSASSRTIATWVNRLITGEERVLKETLALRK